VEGLANVDGSKHEGGGRFVDRRAQPLTRRLPGEVFDERLALRDEHIVSKGRDPNPVPQELLAPVKSLRRRRENLEDYRGIEQDIPGTNQGLQVAFGARPTLLAMTVV
jgi:hypothetical protein